MVQVEHLELKELKEFPVMTVQIVEDGTMMIMHLFQLHPVIS